MTEGHPDKICDAIADRILLLKGGKVVECSTPAEFLKSENRDVKEFLAAMKGEIP